MGVVIDRSGNEPGRDGAIHLYVSPEVGTKSWFDTRRRAIFVDGMDNQPRDHRESAWELSMLLACPVTGVYNMMDGLWADLGQCITDKFKFDASITSRRALSFDDWKGLVDVTYGVVQKDLSMSWDFSKVGFTVAHSFLTYMKHEPEFVINRFRLGGWGMTFNMDEKGLAKVLADMGPNADRLLPIFERLDSAHKGDSDDVVMLYPQRLRATGRESVLRTMAKVKPELIRVLIKILDDGWTTGEEKAAIAGLRRLLG